MTYKQWDRKFRRACRNRPRDERRAAAEYYAELYEDKRDAGLAEEEVLAEFGDPDTAANQIFEGVDEACARKRDASRQATVADTASRTALVVISGLLVGIPVLACIFMLAVVCAAGVLCGGAAAAAGAAQFFYFIVRMISEGASAAYAAHLGIGLGAAGAGLLLIPAFIYLTKQSFRLLGAIFAAAGRFITGKRRNEHAKA